MKQQQSGFTLIELVMVIVILGILAATALPKFVDLQGDAKQSATGGAAGALAAGAAINYATSKIPTKVAGTDYLLVTASTDCSALNDTLVLQSTLSATEFEVGGGTVPDCKVRYVGATEFSTAFTVPLN